MNKLKSFLTGKRAVATIFLVILALTVATPVLANSSSWSFLAFYDRYYINGKTNGVFHDMTAGNMTISGSLTTTMIMGNVLPVQAFTFEVWKVGTLWDTKVCTTGSFNPPRLVGDPATPVSWNCGAQSAGKYYLVIYRAKADNREVTGSGTISTQ